MEQYNIFDFDYKSLTALLVEKYRQSKFRSEQIFRWIYQKEVHDFDLMSDISKDFRETLKRDFRFYLPKLIKKQVSDDNTIKVLIELEDGQSVESVIMRYRYGQAACISSQVGCPMGCKFCATGTIKKIRNLSTAEMIGQLIILNDLLSPEELRITHIVIMGMGEPFDNYDNVMSFIRIANDYRAFEIGARHISVSTCGVVPRIEEYAKEGLQTNLAVSLHAPNNEIRSKIMPINKVYSIEILMETLKKYSKTTGRRVTLEYILIDGLNDQLAHAKELLQLIRGMNVGVNLIPYNPTSHAPYQRSSKTAIHKFFDFLQSKNINATIRKEFGNDIDASCGQLKARYDSDE